MDFIYLALAGLFWLLAVGLVAGLLGGLVHAASGGALYRQWRIGESGSWTSSIWPWRVFSGC